MRFADLYHRGIEAVAFSSAVIATVFEIAVVRHIYGVRNATADIVERVNGLVDRGLALHKSYGVGMKRIVENYDVDEVKVFEPSLNDIFVEYTKDNV